MDANRIKEHLATLPQHELLKTLAILNCYYSRPQMVELFGVPLQKIRYAVAKHREIIEAAAISRNSVIADMTERRVIELLQKMNVDNIADDKKPQAVKYLMDSADIAHNQGTPKDKGKEETTMELIFRIKKKMGNIKKDESEEQDDIVKDAIDITGEIKNEI